MRSYLLRRRLNGLALGLCLAISACAAITNDPTLPGVGNARAWTQVGAREVRDRVEQDTIALQDHRAFGQVRFCVSGNPVHFRDVDVFFRNGGHQDVALAARINPRQCSRIIDLDGGQRDIDRITLRYEEASARRGVATVRVFAR